MTPSKAKEIYKNLCDLRGLYSRQESVAMQLFCHPDATANQVMELQGRLVKARVDYRAMVDSVRVELDRALGRWHGYDINKLKL